MKVIDLDESNAVYAYERSEKQRGRGRWLIFGGILMVFVGCSGFAFALMNPVDPITLQLLSTLPMLAATGLLTAGWSMMSGPNRVVLDAECLQTERGGKSSQHNWSDIGWATVATAAVSQQRVLVVYDTKGKKLAAFGEAFAKFDDLVEVVKSRVNDGPESTATGIRDKKAKRAGLLTGVFGIFMLCAAGGIAWMTYEDLRAEELLKTDGIEGTAIVDGLVLAPNGYTTRVEYTVSNDAGESGSRNAEVTPDYYAELKDANAESVPVVFVPSEPAISRLAEGEVIEDDFTKTPIGGYSMATGGLLMSLFLLGAGVMQWKGWDIDMDSKTGKLSITRFGEGK